jgi:DNA mismatch repair protein MutS
MTSNLNIYHDYYKYTKDLQEKYGKKSVVFLMVGSFYEIYGSVDESYDNVLSIPFLEKICKTLGILLSRRDKKYPVSYNNPHSAGFPCVSLSKNLSKLLEHNYTIGVYDQFDNLRGQKDRKLVNVVSPSTCIDEDINYHANVLACIYTSKFVCPIKKKPEEYGCISYIDLSVGKVNILEFYENSQGDNKCNYVFEEIKKCCLSINPSEIIYLGENGEYFKELQNEFYTKLVHDKSGDTIVNKKFRDIDYCNKFLEKIYTTNSIESPVQNINLDCNGDVLYTFVQLLQFAYDHDESIVTKLSKPNINTNNLNTYLNHDALLQLNLIKSNVDRTGGGGIQTLFDVINFTKTKIGERLLYNRILNPIKDTEELNRRYHNISFFLENNKFKNLNLNGIIDIEKKFRKIVLNKLTKYELAMIGSTFENLETTFDTFLNDYSQSTKLKITSSEHIQSFKDFFDLFSKTFNMEALKSKEEQNIFIKGVFNHIDKIEYKVEQIRVHLKNLESSLTELSSKCNAKAGIRLIYSDNSDDKSLYFETTKKCFEKLSESGTDWAFKFKFGSSGKTLVINFKDLEVINNKKGSTTFSCKLVDVLSNKYYSYVSEMKKLVNEEYNKIMVNYAQNYASLFSNLVTFISDLDFSLSGAQSAFKNVYSRPTLNSEDVLNIKEVRHPIIEVINDSEEYIKNDLTLNDSKKGFLLYGLNSSGKSSLLRAVGINTVMAQAGLYVAAKGFDFKPYDCVLSKISTIDNLFKGQSTFILEMKELNSMFKMSENNRCLLLCDELTAGTEIDSSIGIVSSAVEHFLESKCNFIFTTHLHGLKEIKNVVENPKLDIFHFKVSIESGSNKVDYNRKLEKGMGEENYGVEIASALGLNSSFVKNAFKYRSMFKYNEEIKDGDHGLLLNNRRSHFNKKVIMDACERCGSKTKLQTHHKVHQAEANQSGVIEDKQFHKNAKHNLEVLCEKCHQEEHAGHAH